MNPSSRSTEPLRLPRVTVLMAVYNGAAYLRQAMDSILAQTFRDFEFLIINDGSTDDSRAIVASYNDSRIRILDNPENIGLTRSLNRGLAEARGELIARQDADDVSFPYRLEKEVVFLDARPHLALVGAQTRFISERGRSRASRLWWKATTSAGIQFQLLFDSPFVHTSVLFRRKIVWGALGGYDEKFRSNQDFELWSRLLRNHDAVNMEEVLVEFRAHPASISANYSSVDVRRIESVFEENLRAIFGTGNSYKYWPAMWVNVINPKIAEPLNASEVFKSIEGLYNSFPKGGLPGGAFAEIRLLYASKLLLAARFFARHDKLLSITKALRAFVICPPLATRELLRTLTAILFGRSPKTTQKYSPRTGPELERKPDDTPATY